MHGARSWRSSTQRSDAPSHRRLRRLPATDPTAPIAEALRRAIAQSIGCDVSSTEADPAIRASTNPAFGDFQANFAMPLAKRAGKPPRQLAEAVVTAAAAACEPYAEPLEVAGPGFINIRLRPASLARALEAMDTPSLGVVPSGAGRRVAVDLCGVNVSKEMHVGHLRATIIGDTIARIHGRLGWSVARQNHLGDWGLPIAMVLRHLREQRATIPSLTLADLNRAYRDAQAAAREDPNAAERARQTLVALQSGDADLVRDWKLLIDITMREVYATAVVLGVDLPPESERGESFFSDRLQPTVQAFVDSGIATRDDGALVVRFSDRERPLLIQKSDGAALYATTDLAALRYRVQELGAEKVIYCVDARQRDHFKDVFDAIRLIGWDRLTTGDGRAVHAELVHVPFGSVLGADRKPLKTRSGENVTLRSLLDEACERGRREVRARAADPSSPTHGLGDGELCAIGDAVGIAAVKYADLSSEVTRDYAFDLDRMVAFEGDTGPYLQYATARIAGILARADDGATARSWQSQPFQLDAPEERALALALLRHGSAIEAAAREDAPSRLCHHLSALAVAFNSFYQACPVLKAEPASTKSSRLRLCHLTRRALADGLGLLGITVPERM